MSTETPLANSPEVRTPDGTLKDQGVLTPPQTEQSSTQAKAPTDGQTTIEAPAKQPTEGKSAATDEGKPAPGAPEKYEDFKAPEGFELDKAVLDDVVPLFKELNLNQEQAQKLIDRYAKLNAQAAEAPVKFYADMQKEWRDEAATRFGKAIEPGGKMVTDFATAFANALPPSLSKNFQAALDFTGAGNHPDILEALQVLTKPWLTGTPVAGKGPSPLGQKAPDAPAPSIAQAMYPHLPSASAQR